MNAIFVVAPFAMVAVVALLGPRAERVPDHRRRGAVQFAHNHAADGRQAVSTDDDRASICVLCGYWVADDVAHWKVIHHVPA